MRKPRRSRSHHAVPSSARKHKTHLRFGDYAAVTVYSQKRVPAVLSQTAVLSDDLYELLDAANLDEATQEKSRNRGGSAGS